MKKTHEIVSLALGLSLCMNLCGCKLTKSSSDSSASGAQIITTDEGMDDLEEKVPDVEKFEAHAQFDALYTTMNVDAPVAYDTQLLEGRNQVGCTLTITSQSTLTFSFSDSGNEGADIRRHYGYRLRYATDEDMTDVQELQIYPSPALVNKNADIRETNVAHKEYYDDVTIAYDYNKTTVTIDSLDSGTYWYDVTYINNQADETTSDSLFAKGHIKVEHWNDDSVKTDQTYDLDGGISLIVDTDGAATLKGTGECGDIDAAELMGEDKAKALTSLTIEEGITNIKGFHNSGIRSLTLPNGYETITSGAFSDNTYLHKVSFGDDVKAIEEDAFKNDTHLLTMTLPEKLESFSMIDSLVKLTFNDAFEDYSLIDSDNLKEVVIGKGLKEDMALFKDAKNLVHIVNRSDKTVSFSSLDERVRFRDPEDQKHDTLAHGDYIVRNTIPNIIYDLGEAEIDGNAIATYEYGGTTELPQAKLDDLAFVCWEGVSELGLPSVSWRSIDATEWTARGPITVVPYFEDINVNGGKNLSVIIHKNKLTYNAGLSRVYVVKYSQNEDMSDYDFLYITTGFEKEVTADLASGTWYYTVQFTGEHPEEDPEGSVGYLEEHIKLTDVIMSGSVEID